MNTALVNGLVFDGNGAGPAVPATVLLKGPVVESITPPSGTVVPPGWRVLDVSGGTVLPALVDGHMHLSLEPGRLDHFGHLRTNLAAVGKLRECLLLGTGTVGHAAGSQESIILRDLVREGSLAGCADLLVGAAVTPTCGHVRGRTADGPWEIRRAVRELVAAGADWIKTCASGGFQHAHEKLTHEDYTLEELRVLTEQAHAREKRVHVHAHARPGLDNAVDAGCDVILHGVMIDAEILGRMAEKALWYMPTLFVTSEKFYGRPGMPAYMADRMKQAAPGHRAGVALARETGVRVAVGTDGWHGSVIDEVRELAGCGFSPVEALRAATRDTAEALGILGRAGTLETGKQADLFVVRGDPTRDLEALSAPDAFMLVMKGGRVVRAGRGFGAELEQ